MASEPSRPISRWHWLLTLPLLTLAAYVSLAWRDIDAYLTSTELLFKTAPLEASVSYGGVDWKLVGSEFISGATTPVLQLKDDRQLVHALIDMTAADQLAAFDGRECQVSLADDKGRHWSPLDGKLAKDIAKLLDPATAPLPSCAEALASLVKGAKHQVMSEMFLIPTHVGNNMSLKLSVRPLLPIALSFSLPPKP